MHAEGDQIRSSSDFVRRGGNGRRRCASLTDESTADDGESDLVKSHAFTCTNDDENAFDNLAVSGSGASTTIKVTNDTGTYTGKIDMTYPSSRTSAADANYRRFTWVKNDPWEDTGSSWMLVDTEFARGQSRNREIPSERRRLRERLHGLQTQVKLALTTAR